MNSRVLITGATGFVGGRLAAYLAEMPEVTEVIATGRKSTKTEFLQHGKINFLSGELSDTGFVKQLFVNKPQFVVHCAGLSSPWGSRKEFFEANVLATKKILEESIGSSVHRLVLISTPSVYFNFKDRFNISEHEPLPKKMVNLYAETKLEAEQLVLFANGKGIETIASRPRANDPEAM